VGPATGTANPPQRTADRGDQGPHDHAGDSATLLRVDRHHAQANDKEGSERHVVRRRGDLTRRREVRGRDGCDLVVEPAVPLVYMGREPKGTTVGCRRQAGQDRS
jgi:hypothetical protein